MYFYIVNLSLLHPDVQTFIRNYSEEISVLALKGSPFEGISAPELIQQIEGFRRTKKKLPTWHQKDPIYFPPKLNVEQSSSEKTAKYKASLVSGRSLADCTGGFGVDSYYFSKVFDSVDHYELDKVLSSIVKYNFKQFGITNIHCVSTDGINAIKDKKYEVIYVDPTRRHEAKGKVFFLKDCEPYIVDHLSNLLENCDTLLLKTSPMLDIAVGLDELDDVAQIHVVAVDNEVKELLWVLRKKGSETIEIKTVNIGKSSTENFGFIYGEAALPSYGSPRHYLYEPNRALLKAGAFNNISEVFHMDKLHPNSHLYTGDQLIDFPGRRFKIVQQIPYNKRDMKQYISNSTANVATRNFLESVKDLRKKWKIKDGGNRYLFFTTTLDDHKVVLDCIKVTA
ncbi:MAG: class I SAM-dependent methyltransferase [Bacteroidetes bacterium]|nr:class I SAM-dependent methyltransferase [Bacteroidota bacterium]